MINIKYAKDDGWNEIGVPGIFNQRDALAPSIVCPVNIVTTNNPTVIANKIELSLPIYSYLMAPIPRMIPKPITRKTMCLRTCEVVVPLFAIYSRLELAE